MKNLFVDMDNTICDTIRHVICSTNKYTELDIIPKYEEIVNPDLFSIYGYDVEYVWEKVLSKNHKFIQPVAGAVDCLNNIIESQKYNVSINTARSEEWAEAAKSWLKYHGFELDIVFTPSGRKYDEVDGSNSIIIEDNIMELKRVKYATALLLDVPWSKTYAINNNIIQVKDWYQIEKILLRI